MITTKDKSPKDWEYIATQILFILRSEGREFTADDFYRHARTEAMPPAEIKRLAGCMFRQFAASGYIKKTNRFRLSERNGSSPLPIWEGLTK